METDSLESLDREMKEHIGSCCGRYKDEVLYGKRCLNVVELFFDSRDKIFYRFEKPGRVRCTMIENTKKGFYIQRGDAINEYFFDSFEGWYIQSFHHGHKYNYTNEASVRYRQCDVGLRLNTLSANLASSAAAASSGSSS